jgi:hypothetical protein
MLLFAAIFALLLLVVLLGTLAVRETLHAER